MVGRGNSRRRRQRLRTSQVQRAQAPRGRNAAFARGCEQVHLALALDNGGVLRG
jgi:hypothetical protein